ncbi:MAG: hypothetical protein IJW20_04090 [Clostridia bacterium]|nr:hypothetical protein [Clostridia bacterium]
MENLTDQEICVNLKRLYNETENQVKTNAMVSRAFIDKVSIETINNKVTSQMNSIKTSIYNINPKFKEGSKNYELTKKLVTESLAAYEQALIELSQFYDGKIEQLILRKVELESSLIGTILNAEYLRQELVSNTDKKENDKVKTSVKDSIRAVLERFKNKKTDKTESINPMEISKLMDQQDVVCEIEQQFSNKIEKRQADKISNDEFSKKIEKELALINSEIERINDRKKQSIIDAMEVGNKEVTTSIRKPRVIKKITSFFASRFNTAKVVETTIIDPLNLRIESFKANELSSMKG